MWALRISSVEQNDIGQLQECVGESLRMDLTWDFCFYWGSPYYHTEEF